MASSSLQFVLSAWRQDSLTLLNTLRTASVVSQDLGTASVAVATYSRSMNQ